MTGLKSPQQQIFDTVYAASLKLGYETFYYKPASSTGFPFVFIGEQFDQDVRTKDTIYGTVQQTIHIYHTYRKRRELTGMVDRLKVELRKLRRTENFFINCRNITGQILIENSTGEPLLHGIIEVEFRFH